MDRTYIDCCDFPSDMNCTVAIAADSPSELLEAAVPYAVPVHQHQDTPEFRQQSQQLFKAERHRLSIPAKQRHKYRVYPRLRRYRRVAWVLFSCKSPILRMCLFGRGC